MTALKEALEGMAYRPAPGRENYQWRRTVEFAGREEPIKVDLLGQIPTDTEGISIRKRRMRPHGFTGLHANPLEEAAFIHLKALTVAVCEDGERGLVELPHPFNYMLLKLFAFRDRKHDETVDYGRHHAFDLYRIVAMLTPDEWDEVRELRSGEDGAPVVQEAVGIVQGSFMDEDALGTLRIREYARDSSITLDTYPVQDFLEDLHELWLG